MIYIIKDKEFDLCKIGYSCNPIERIRSFQIGKDNLETILIMPGGRDREKKLHEMFSCRRVTHPNPRSFIGNGWTEWFRLRPNEISRIRNSYIKKLDSMQEKLDELEHMDIVHKRNEKILYGVIQSLEDTMDKIKELYMSKFWEDKQAGMDRDIFKDEIALEFIGYKRYSKLRIQ